MRCILLPAMLGAAALALPVAAQPQPVKPIKLRGVPVKRPAAVPTAPVFEKGVKVVRPGRKTAAQWSATLKTTTAIYRKPRMIAVAVATIPGIFRVNGAAGGDLEPGGDYEIAGSGFGTRAGSVFLRVPGGRTIPLAITHWSDSAIYAHVPGDVSGLPDSSAELAVGPAGKPPYKTQKFGFRAAREDIALPISDAMFRHEGAGSVTVGGITVPVSSPPRQRAFDGRWYQVWRNVSDGDEKKCITPGRDRISWSGLKHGFEVTAYYYERMPFRKTENETPRGSWAFAWEGDSIRIDFGVVRYYVPRFVLVGGHGSCSSFYKITLTATGPRGMKPL